MRSLRAVLCGCVVAVLASGCAPGASGPLPSVPASGASGSADAAPTQLPSVRPSETGVRTGSPVSSPQESIPAALPVYPGSHVLPAAGLLGRWTVDAEPPAVFGYFVDELPRGGFVILAQLPGGDAAIIRFAAADGSLYQLDLTGHAPVLITLGSPHD